MGIVSLVVLTLDIPEQDHQLSTVVYDSNGDVLASRISKDQQWRYPIEGDLPDDFVACIRYYEDQYFYYHTGVNPITLAKAIIENYRAKRIVRGGSTISMQVMRMYYGNQPRTILQKCKEIAGALKLELVFSKAEIVKKWASLAPFGGNTVGAQTAAMRYFDRGLNDLSWAEYATLAVLPNAPATIHMNRNTERLRKKRDFLLHKLFMHGVIDRTDYSLACSEDIPVYDPKVQQKSIHLLAYLEKKYPNQKAFHTSIDPLVQKDAQSVIDEYSRQYQVDGISNAAALIVDNISNQVVAYVGNVSNTSMHYVDCIQGKRSYGSLLKPFLYAYTLSQGAFLPDEVVKDIPTNINGFIPKNFDKAYRGQIPLGLMVTQSLNIPAVRVLNYVGLEKFHKHLREDLRLTSIHPDPNHHGLSIILGGAESTLWDMVRIYKGLARNNRGLDNPYADIGIREKIIHEESSFSYDYLDLGYVLDAMQSVKRPREEQMHMKLGGEDVAWKTGTSYGHRDAWSIGIKGRYTVGIWVGNEDGKGVYDLTGVKKAAPILFKILRNLPEAASTANLLTYDHIHEVSQCLSSGRLAGPLCKETKTIKISHVFHELRTCNLHSINSTSGDTLYHPDPVAAYYYHAFYDSKHSRKNRNTSSLKIVYPEPNMVMILPKKLDGERSRLTAEVYRDKDRTLYWYLDGNFLATTNKNSALIDVSSGKHTLFVVDAMGQEDQIEFSIEIREPHTE